MLRSYLVLVIGCALVTTTAACQGAIGGLAVGSNPDAEAELEELAEACGQGTRLNAESKQCIPNLTENVVVEQFGFNWVIAPTKVYHDTVYNAGKGSKINAKCKKENIEKGVLNHCVAETKTRVDLIDCMNPLRRWHAAAAQRMGKCIVDTRYRHELIECISPMFR